MDCWLGLVLLVCVLVAAAWALPSYGAYRWGRTTLRLTQQLEAGKARQSSPTHYDARELEGLPGPVQRYFRAALADGQPLIAAATVEVTGHINVSACGERWKYFSSQQRIITRRPGFLWVADVALLPGLVVRVVDGYIAGQGQLRAAVLGLFKVAEVHGGGEIARSELMRFFAEAAWYPTALLPSQGVRWDGVDEASANATFVDGPFTLTLLFRFDEAGLIASAHAAARGAMVGNQLLMLPWEGRWSNYQLRDGMKLPMTGEAAWLPAGRNTYFCGEVTSLSFEYAI